jgi:galactokinase
MRPLAPRRFGRAWWRRPLAAGDPERIRLVRAPGWVNLIGEHTDYNLGFVLPAAIDLEIRIAFVPTADRRVELVNGATGERSGFDLDAIGPRRGAWIDYAAGTAWALSRAGIRMHGLRGVIVSSLPTGSGLSSSASIELAAARGRWPICPAAASPGSSWRASASAPRTSMSGSTAA